MEDISNILQKGRYGFHVKGRLRDHFDMEDVRKVGYALRYRSIPEVVYNDGMNGRPLWICIDDNVFNITGKFISAVQVPRQCGYGWADGCKKTSPFPSMAATISQHS